MKCALNLLQPALLAVLLASCAKEAPNVVESKAAPPLVLPASAVARAATRSITPSFEHPGIIEAVQTADVHPEVSATLLASHFKAGDIVAKGALLIELDPAVYQASLEIATAELMSAEANALQSNTDWERAENLSPKGYISAQDYDRAKANVSVARANVAKARAQLSKAELDLKHTKLYAPFSGRISKPRYAVGDSVTPGGKAMFQLVQLDPIYATSSVVLGNYNKFVILRTEMENRGIDIPKLELSLELVGGEAYPHRGTFQNWSHSSTQSSGMIKGRALFVNPDGLLLPGQNVVLSGKTLERFERVMVPQSAVLQDQQGYYVMIIGDEGKVRRKNLEMGLRDGTDWAVRSGLNEGARVILQGGQALRPGAPVSVADDGE